ncbi:hypothetical protein TIFTF001_010953 [Ficus carica]|uniref:Uncharacterized protein n=1 Tax=Ficus carica TaxID=3494 RepID=A0AA88D2G1_FICCA|nr:hypothetical protein TIFTF001_010953 [Ficus carica]
MRGEAVVEERSSARNFSENSHMGSDIPDCTWHLHCDAPEWELDFNSRSGLL